MVAVLAARTTTVPRWFGRAASLPPTKGYFVNRLWSRVGVRVASVGLLVLGLTGGIYFGQNREVQQQSTEANVVAQVAVDDMQLLKQRQSEHAAARAWQRAAEGDAAEKAATEAKAAAGKAHKLEKKAVEKKKAAEEAKKAEEAAESGDSEDGDSGGPVQFTGPIPSSCSGFSGSRGIGCTIMLQKGFGLDQWPCLDKLWKKESGWNYKATNRSSGAYGIPQALPGKKMASAGSDWRTNPATQIKWGLGYIKGRYGTPCAAWGHSQDVGWY